MQRFECNGLTYYQFERLNGVTHGVFTRLGGVSAAPFNSLNLGGSVGDDPTCVRENHMRMYDALGVDDARSCSVWQVHGVEVVIADRSVREQTSFIHADGMITDRYDTPLSMRFADCTPILLHDPVQGVIGMAHAGWRGTVKGMAAGIIGAMMKTYGCKPVNIVAGIGPSISVERYQVGAEVIDAARAYFGDIDGLVRIDPTDGTSYFDLWAANARDLQHVGVEQIEITDICTAQRTDEFFSHRAEKGKTGRFGAVICMT